MPRPDMFSFPNILFSWRSQFAALTPAEPMNCPRRMQRSIGSQGYSLIELMVSTVVLSVAMLGIISAWKLSDDKELAARLDERATRILKEFSELQSFAPDFLFGQSASSYHSDFEAQGVPLNPGETRTGFLYHSRHIDLNGGKSTGLLFDDAVPYQLSLRSDAQGQLISISYQLPYLPESSAKITRQIRLNPRQQ